MIWTNGLSIPTIGPERRAGATQRANGVAWNTSLETRKAPIFQYAEKTRC